MIAGLGNPGPKYAETRHNAGFWFLDRVVHRYGGAFREQGRLRAETARIGIAGRECILVRPTTFMNESGLAVRAVLTYFRIPEAALLVAYDELDLQPGTVRLKLGGGHGGHNGLRDIFRHIPERGFLRLRIGIGHPGFKDQVTDYVLSRPGAEDELRIRESIERAAEVVPDIVAGDIPRAMKQLHTSE
jgi:PTH1 family peptidyl-tRNA hydrolase